MEISKQNRAIFGGIILLILFFSGMDIVSDYLEGSPNSHLLIELLILGLTGIAMGWLIIDFLKNQLRLTRFKQDLKQVEEDRNNWKTKAETFLDGLSDTIETQFEKWNLSKSEIQIGFMLLKGYSHKDIAKIRKTSTKTVQTQSQSIYKKTNLKTRSELSAFFLEDLLPKHDL